MFAGSFAVRNVRSILIGAAFAAIAVALPFAGSGSAQSGANAPSAAGASIATPYEIDIAHSTLNFRIKHFGVCYFFGRINQPEGTFLLDAANPANSHLHVTVAIKNMDAGNDSRNKFLMGLDFFNSVEFPTAEFKSTSIKRIDATTWEATGDFTMRGVKKNITIKLEEYAEAKTSRFGNRAGFLGSFTVKRSDFGMSNFMDENMLGDEVLIFAGIEGARE